MTTPAPIMNTPVSAPRKGFFRPTIVNGQPPEDGAPVPGTEKKRKLKGSGELHPAARWALQRLAQDPLAVDFGGLDRDGDPVLYRWTGHFWHAQPVLDLAAEALTWLAVNAPKKATSGSGREAASTLVDFARLRGAPLPQWPVERGTVIGTRSHDLVLARDGTMRATAHAAEHGATALIQADVDAAQIGPDGTYTPCEAQEGSVWRRYIEQTLPDPEVRALAQEALGSTLLDTTLEKILVLAGPGENGKSVFVHCCTALHGQSHVALSMRDLSAQFGLEVLVGKTLATITEAESHLSDAGMQTLKALASRDPMRADRKYARALTFVPKATLLLSLNNPLSYKDQSHGALRRWLTIPFTRRVPEHEKIPDFHRLITQHPAEMRALLDWALAGAQRLIQRGRKLPPEPGVMRQMREQQRADTDAIYAWVRDCEVAAGAGSWILKPAVYAAFRAHAAAAGHTGIHAEPAFWRRVRAIIEERGAVLSEGRVRIAHGERPRVVALQVAGIPPAVLGPPWGPAVEPDGNPA